MGCPEIFSQKSEPLITPSSNTLPSRIFQLYKRTYHIGKATFPQEKSFPNIVLTTVHNTTQHKARF